jgi:heat shock protein HtpX
LTVPDDVCYASRSKQPIGDADTGSPQGGHEVMSNMFKTALLLGVLTAMLVLIGGAVGGRQGMLIAFIFAVAMNFASYWFSDKIVLSMYGAQPIEESEAPALYAIVRRLATRAGIPMPRVYLISVDTPNAFATGRDPEHAAVAVTEGIMRILNEEELEGVLAHELSHVKNRDVLISTIAATLAGAITYLAHMAQWAAFFGGGRSEDDEGGSAAGMILMAILAPIAALLVQMAVSRSREYQADATGARLAGRSWGLAGALEKLQIASQAVPMAANPATAHLFIVNPLSGRALMSLFSTHPPIEERIARLRSMRLGAA